MDYSYLICLTAALWDTKEEKTERLLDLDHVVDFPLSPGDSHVLFSSQGHAYALTRTDQILKLSVPGNMPTVPVEHSPLLQVDYVLELTPHIDTLFFIASDVHIFVFDSFSYFFQYGIRIPIQVIRVPQAESI